MSDHTEDTHVFIDHDMGCAVVKLKYIERYISTYLHNCAFQCYVYVILGLTSVVSPSISSTIADNFASQTSPAASVIQSPSMEYNQQNILIVSQPSSLVSIVSDAHTTTSPVTTLSVVECLTTNSSVVTSISGQHISTNAIPAGIYKT